MNETFNEYLITFTGAYLLTSLMMLAYKAAIKDLNTNNFRRFFNEVKSVHPLALLSAAVSLIPVSVFGSIENSQLKLYVSIGVGIYFILTFVYRKLLGLKMLDFSIDTGSNFNEEISADPTLAQTIWLFTVSWAGGVLNGLVLGTMLSVNSWKGDVDWLVDRPGDDESRIYLYVFAGLILLSMMIALRLRAKKHRRLPTARRLRALVVRGWMVPAFFGVFFGLLQAYTRNLTLTNRYFTMFLFAWIALASLWSLVFVAPSVRAHLREERKFFEEQQKRLKNKKRSNRKR